MGFENGINIYNRGEFGREDEAKALEELEKTRSDGLQPMEGELDKSRELLEQIEAINALIEKEFTELDLPKPSPLKPEQYHFLKTKNFKKLSDEKIRKNITGLAYIKENKIVINHDELTQSHKKLGLGKGRFFGTMLHEALHLAAYQKYILDKEAGQLEYSRTGYNSQPVVNEDEPDSYSIFDDFNEAITEKTCFKLINNNLYALPNEVRNEWEIYFDQYSNPRDANKSSGYKTQLDILDTIINKIARKQKQRGEYIDTAKDRVLERFEKGYFSGEMMHLREIERLFGRGSLRVLANVNKKNLSLVKTFFSTTDETKKLEAEKRIFETLPKTEQEKLEKRKESIGISNVT